MKEITRETLYLYLGGVLVILFLILVMYELSISLSQQQVSSLAYYYN